MVSYDNWTPENMYGSEPMRPKTGIAMAHDKMLAIARVVMQPPITEVYSAGDALRQGTLFPELDKPFLKIGGGH